jgi:hypothetical protein
MRTPAALLFLAPLVFEFAVHGQNPPQTQAPQPRTTQSNPATPPKGRGAGGDIGHGSGDIGKGTGEGAGKAAEGVGKGTGDLVTGHPGAAAGNVGKGAGDAGKDVGVGAVKGTGKIGKGTGKLVAKPFHHSKKIKSPEAKSPDTSSPSGETLR